MPTAPSRDPFSRLGLLVAVWLPLTVVVVAQAALVLRVRDIPYNPAYMVAGLVNGLVWIGVTPLIARIVRRWPLVAPGGLRNLGVHVAAVAAIHAAAILLVVALAATVDTEPTPFGYTYLGTWSSLLVFYLLVYSVVAAVVHAYEAHRRALAREAEARERDVRAARLRAQTAALEAQLVQAQLGALRAQLQPHFLFNTLHAASALMARDVDGARGVLADLSDLLRAALDRDDEPEISLAEEVDVLRSYLRIVRARMGSRLSLTLDIAPEAERALVPPLVLQPLVENAVEHGVAPRAAGGAVVVRAWRDGDALVLCVEDDGVGLPGGAGGDGAARPAEGVGLGNTRQRLAGLYGDAGRLALRPCDGGGLSAEVRLPFHTDALVRTGTPARP